MSKENERLQSLIDDATTREQRRAELQEELKDITARSGIFESSRNRESRESIVEEIAHLEDLDQEARTAAENIKQNERTILDLSKENTILSYEQKSINDVFGSFEDFELANRSLYANYLASLKMCIRDRPSATGFSAPVPDLGDYQPGLRLDCTRD